MSYYLIFIGVIMAFSGLALVFVIVGMLVIGVLRRVWRVGVWLWIKSVDFRVSRSI